MKRFGPIVILLVLLNLMLFSCGSGDDQKSQPPRPDSGLRDTASNKVADSYSGNINSSYDSSSAAVQDLKRVFRIEKKNGNGIFLQLYIYLSDTSKLEAVNRYLKVRFLGQYPQALDVWYFDKKNFVKKYLNAVDNDNISDDDFKSLDRHMICQYSWAGSGDGSFEYNTK